MKFEVIGPICDEEAAWQLIGDPSRIARELSVPGEDFTLQPQEDGLAVPVGTTQGGLLRHRVVEADVSWVRGRMHRRLLETQGLLGRRIAMEWSLEREASGEKP